MKAKLLITVTVILFLTSHTSVLAQDSANTSDQTTDSATQLQEDRLKQRLNTLQSDAAQRRQNISDIADQRRQEFKDRLQTIRDEAKKTIVERIDTKIATINTNATIRLSSALNKLSSAITRIEDKITSDQNESQEVLQAIDTAKASIEAAETAVDEQASKSYIIEITDEESLRQAVSTVVQQFKSDLDTTKRSVLQAKSDTLTAARLANS